MSIVLDGTTGITTPTTNGTAEHVTSVTGFKNRIINGGMVIDQRNAGASVTPSGQYTLDRWIASQSVASKYSVQQNAGAVTPPVGFSNYLGITSLSAYSILTGDYYIIRQSIEGFNFADMAWGTTSAAAVTLSFKVYSSLTGTFGGSLANNAQNRNYPFTYSIPVANTWTTISVTIAGDTTGTWLTTNGCGLQLNFGLGVGATYSGTAGSWNTGNYFSATGAVSVVGTSGATFYITGVQLEKGSVATSFDYRPYSTELSLCQRYYWQQTNVIFTTGFYRAGNTSLENNKKILPVPMRITPNCTAASPTGTGYTNGTSVSLTSITSAAADDNTQINLVIVTSASTQGLPGWFNLTSTLTASAEL